MTYLTEPDCGEANSGWKEAVAKDKTQHPREHV
jgi:hypothetical protein